MQKKNFTIYTSYTCAPSLKQKYNVYINPSMSIIPQSSDVPDLGISCRKTVYLILTFPVFLGNVETWLAGYLDHSSPAIN